MTIKEYAELAEKKEVKTITDLMAIELNKLINAKKGEKKNDNNI